jgi:hypothetical protein
MLLLAELKVHAKDLRPAIRNPVIGAGKAAPTGVWPMALAVILDLLRFGRSRQAVVP